jgi:hypothetical protein
MGLQANGEVSKFPPGDSRLGQTAGPILSLNEAWYHTVDKCVNYGPVSEIILPLMHNCFFWRSAARGSAAAEGSWRAAGFRYCWLLWGKAAVVTRSVSHADY